MSKNNSLGTWKLSYTPPKCIRNCIWGLAFICSFSLDQRSLNRGLPTNNSLPVALQATLSWQCLPLKTVWYGYLATVRSTQHLYKESWNLHYIHVFYSLWFPHSQITPVTIRKTRVLKFCIHRHTPLLLVYPNSLCK